MIQLDLSRRFWSLVDKTGGPLGCWLWRGYVRRIGYGQFERCSLAHRLAYELTIGTVPAGMVLDHVCRNRACVNPLHLEVVTGAENTRRGSRVGVQKMAAVHRAKTHCPRGHEYTEENTRRSRGRRLCKECGRADARRRYWRQREAA